MSRVSVVGVYNSPHAAWQRELLAKVGSRVVLLPLNTPQHRYDLLE